VTLTSQVSGGPHWDYWLVVYLLFNNCHHLTLLIKVVVAGRVLALVMQTLQ